MKKPIRRSVSTTFEQLFGAHAKAMRRELKLIDSVAADLALDFAYEKVWARGRISIRERSMATVASLIAMGRPAQLRWHLHGLLAQGCDWGDVRELCLQMLPYCGFPAVFEALKVVREMEKGMRKERARPNRSSGRRSAGRNS